VAEVQTERKLYYVFLWTKPGWSSQIKTNFNFAHLTDKTFFQNFPNLSKTVCPTFPQTLFTLLNPPPRQKG